MEKELYFVHWTIEDPSFTKDEGSLTEVFNETAQLFWVYDESRILPYLENLYGNLNENHRIKIIACVKQNPEIIL